MYKMSFSKGDKVFFINESREGYVVELNNNDTLIINSNVLLYI